MPGSAGGGIRSIFAAIRAAPVPLRHVEAERARGPRHFVTISRAGGAGGHTIAQMLVNRLNALDPGEEPWALWDRALVEKICGDLKIAQDVVESLEVSGRTWLEDFLAGLSMESDQTEAKVYGRVVASIRALAQKGRVVIVGRGGVYITRNMPGGVHLRLVAPLEYRARYMARQLGLSFDQAMAHVRQLDHQRAAFFQRYWPKEMRAPEVFSVTINTSLVSEECVVESVLPLVLPDVQAFRTEHCAEMAE